jgi:pilus assembly protein CpaC
MARVAGEKWARTGRRRAKRIESLAACMLACGLALGPSAGNAQANGYGQEFGGYAGASRTVTLGLSKSIIVELPVAAQDVLVSDPETADAMMRSARRAYIIGKKVGQTNIFFFDEHGQRILALEVQVERDIAMLESTIARLVPGSQVGVEALNDNVVLTGNVRSPADSKVAADIAGRFLGDPLRVLNMINVHGEEQVHLKVTVAEVHRTVLKQLEIDLATIARRGAAVFSAPLAVAAGVDAAASWRVGNTEIEARLKALEKNGMLRTLAEPTLTAISGETANFLAGGEFPYLVESDDDDKRDTYEFKEFGVQLSFTPVVMSEGRISIRVASAVSELDLSFGTQVPAIRVRRADTTVELPSGGALTIAGLIQEELRQNFSGTPGLMNIPILGALFRSREFQKSETELVIIVTPYLVRPVAPDQLATPVDGLAPASDAAGVLLGRFNTIYSPNGGVPPKGHYRGRYGFIYD